MTSSPALASLREIGKQASGLRLLVLFGSRARGDARPDSDWDFGYIGMPELDPAVLIGDLVRQLRTERIDLVNFERCGGVLRFAAAREGVVVFEKEPGEFEKFWFNAVSFWCDVERIVRRAQEDVLKELHA